MNTISATGHPCPWNTTDTSCAFCAVGNWICPEEFNVDGSGGKSSLSGYYRGKGPYNKCVSERTAQQLYKAGRHLQVCKPSKTHNHLFTLVICLVWVCFQPTAKYGLNHAALTRLATKSNICRGRKRIFVCADLALSEMVSNVLIKIQVYASVYRLFKNLSQHKIFQLFSMFFIPFN